MKLRPVVRVLEALLWVGVAALLAVRVVPQLRAAVGWGSAAGTPAPDITLVMMNGSVQPLADLRGRVVLLNYWATWCPPCRAEMPGFQDVWEARRDSGFTVIGISADDRPRDVVEAFLEDHRITYPIAQMSPQAAVAFGEISSLPTSLLIDKRGRVRYTVKGFFTETALRAAVDRLLAE